MTDLHFRATTEFAFNTIGVSLGIMVPDNGGAKPAPGVNVDVIEPGGVINTPATGTTPAATSPHIHYNVRLNASFDGNLVKRNFEQGQAKTVASIRRPGVNHSWFSQSFGPQGEVWLIDPAPITPARIWLGDAAPAVGRG